MKKPPKWGEESSINNTITIKQKLGCNKAFDLPTTQKIFFIWLTRHLTGSARPVPFSHPLGLLLNLNGRKEGGDKRQQADQPNIGQHKVGHI
jgi:hypothetical protein